MMCYCTPSLRTPYCHNCPDYMRTEIESLRQQLADTQAKYAAREQECRTAFGKEMELRKQLAECKWERDEWEIKFFAMCDVERRLREQLDAVTKERDELKRLFDAAEKVEPVAFVTDSGYGAVLISNHGLDDGTPLYAHPTVK